MAVQPLVENEIHELTWGDHFATVRSVGAALHEYQYADRDLVDGPDLHSEAEMSAARGEILMPHPNRVHRARYEFAGRHYVLPLTREMDPVNAIHGMVRNLPWTLVDHNKSRLALELILAPTPGYPFPLRCEVAYELDANGLLVNMMATNLGDRPCPFGMGAHPYLTTSRNHRVDDLSLSFPARTKMLAHDQIPFGAATTAGTSDDYSAAKSLRDVTLDDAFTGFECTDRINVDLVPVEGGPGTRLWLDKAFKYLMVFTSDTLPDDQYRRSVALEPMTCAPDAFNNREGLHVLEPADTLSASFGISPI